MSVSEQSVVKVEAEMPTTLGTARIVRFFLAPPIDNIAQASETYHLNFCLTPRPPSARAGYPEPWGPHRFEQVGDIFLIPPGFRLHHRSDGGEQTSIVCEIDRAAVDRWLEGEVEWTDRRLEASLDVPSPHIRALLTRLAEESNRPGVATSELTELIMSQLAIEISRFCTSISEGPVTGGLAAWRLRLIDRRLRESGLAPTLADLARICNLSIRQLTRGFRVSRGCSINDYVSRGRIEQAKRLLATNDSIKTIAFAVGFSSPSSFAQAFREAVGSTPREFRQRVRRSTG